MITVDERIGPAVGSAAIPCWGCGAPVQVVVMVEDVGARERRMVAAQESGDAAAIAAVVHDPHRVRDLCLCRACAHDLCAELVAIAREVEQERARAALEVMAGAVAGKGRRGPARPRGRRTR